MEEISMVDLRRQYLAIKSEIDDAIKSVIDSTSFIRGEEVKLFENELGCFMGSANVIGCGNGTDALQVALMALDLQPGDEVITTNFTFIATIEVIALLGLIPVLAEPDPFTYNISPDSINKAITDRTKVILPVHLFGQCANMEEISSIADRNRLYIIEDTAQALGTDYIYSDNSRKRAGTIGTIGTTSFFPSKNLGCYGDGGAIFTDNTDLATKMRSIVNHGMTRKYYHDYIGVNSRLDTLQAALLRVKLKYLERYNKTRLDAADHYDAGFSSIRGVQIPQRVNYSSHIFHQYTLKLDSSDRDRMRDHLSQNGIPSMIYYPVPLHRQKAYSYLNLEDNLFPVTDELVSRVLSLPMHSELTDNEIEYIISKVLDFY